MNPYAYCKHYWDNDPYTPEESCQNTVYRSGLCKPHYELARIARKKELARERRAVREYTITDRADMLVRSINAMTINASDEDAALMELVRLEGVVEAAIQRVVDHKRTAAGGSYSWAQIAQSLGLKSAQAAQQKYGKRRNRNLPPVEAARKVGGQPPHLR